MISRIISLAISMSLAMPGVASADDGVGGFDGDGDDTQAVLSADELAKASVKESYAARYYEYRKAGGLLGGFPEGLGELERVLNGGQPFEGVTMTSNYPAGQDWNMVSNRPYEDQATNYYCGPASAWAALKHLYAGNSHLGQSLTQSNLARSEWLNTTTAGTGRDSRWTNTLNGWSDGTSSGWYVLTNFGDTTGATVAGYLITNVDNGYEPVFNVQMDSSRGYLPGWSSSYGSVGHYVPGYGYDNYGDDLWYIEVFAPVGSGYKSASKESFANKLDYKGMIW